MDANDIINALNRVFDLGDQLDNAGGGAQGLTNGEHTTREVCKIELGQFLLYLASSKGQNGSIILHNRRYMASTGRTADAGGGGGTPSRFHGGGRGGRHIPGEPAHQPGPGGREPLKQTSAAHGFMGGARASEGLWKQGPSFFAGAGLQRFRAAQKAMHGRLQGLVEAENFAHAKGGDDGPLPDAVELAEVDQGKDQGDDGYRAVKAHFHHGQRLMRFGGHHLHDAFSGQGKQVGGQVEQNAQGNERHADKQVQQPHAVNHGGGKGHQRGIGKEHLRQQVGKVREVAKAGGADQLENPSGLKILSLKDKLKNDVQRENNNNPVAHGQGGEPLGG